MKANIVFVLASFAILEVYAGRVFDEKTAAKNEIDKKLKDVIVLGNRITTFVEDEKKLVNKSTGEVELKNYLLSKINGSKIQFENDADATIRTAIVQAKPVAVIYCIRNVTFSGYDILSRTASESLFKVYQLKIKKLNKIEFDFFAVRAILSGLKELMEQAKKKIDAEPLLIQAIKNEALNRCESATLLLGEIEVCLHEPVLSREYIKLRQSIDRDLKTIKIMLNTELEKCLSAKKKIYEYNSF